MEQLPEIIIIDNVLYSLYTTPLLPWIHEQPSPPKFDQRAPNCDRGYVCRWLIQNDELWLTGLYAWQNGEPTRVRDLFDAEYEIRADWFSGPLVVEPAASEVGDGAAGLGVRTIMIEDGRVVGTLDH